MSFLKHARSLLSLLAASLSTVALAQPGTAPAWLWARSGGGAAASDYSRGASCDAAGNTFITGDFYGTQCLLGTALYDSVGGSGDAYIVKVLPDGTPSWVRTFGGANSEVGVDIATDSTGAAILAGTYGSSPLGCGMNAAGQAVNVTLPSGVRGVLLVKVNTLGQTVWATGFSGTGTAAGNEVATGPNDEVLVIGPFAQNGGTTLTLPDATVLTTAGGDEDVFVAKFNSAGAFQWGLGLNGDAHEEGRGIVVDGAGNVFICGQFDGHLTFGPESYTTAGASDIFVAKYSQAGALLWSRQFGSTGADAARGIAAAPDGGIYVSGEFRGSVAFGDFTLTAAGSLNDLFLLKLDVNGEVVWARAFGSTGDDSGCEIESDRYGAVYGAGSARAGLTFPGGLTVSNAGNTDQFVVKFDAHGTLLWATSGGGPNSDSNFALGVDPQGRVSVVGGYSGTATYGGSNLSTGHGTSIDFYLARLDTLPGNLTIDPLSVTGGALQLEVTAANATWFTLQGSADLLTWAPLSTQQVQLSDHATLSLPVANGVTRQFYRAQTPPALRVEPMMANVTAGGSVTLNAMFGGVTNNAAASWSVVEAGGGTVTAAGLYTAPAQAGTYHVRAASFAEPGLATNVTMNVVTTSAAEQARFADAGTYSDSVLGDGLLIMKSGAVVYEHYAGTTTASTAHLLASGTKSFNAALFILGEVDGIWTLDENVSQTITEWQVPAGQPPTNKSQITIRQLISLSSGLLDSPLYSAGNAANLDTYDLAINASTTPSPPGTACIYAPSNFQVLAAMFERKTGLDPVLYLYDRLLSHLSFNAASLPKWTRDIKGKPQMAGGAYFSARDWANYGKLWIQNGVWQGQTLLNPATLQLAVTYDNPTFKGYGFTWWLNLPTGNTYNPPTDQIPADGHGDGSQIATNAPVDLFMAAGTGKQRLYVIPSLDLVIVRFGHGVGGSFSDHTLLGKILGVPLVYGSPTTGTETTAARSRRARVSTCLPSGRAAVAMPR